MIKRGRIGFWVGVALFVYGAVYLQRPYEALALGSLLIVLLQR